VVKVKEAEYPDVKTVAVSRHWARATKPPVAVVPGAHLPRPHVLSYCLSGVVGMVVRP